VVVARVMVVVVGEVLELVEVLIIGGVAVELVVVLTTVQSLTDRQNNHEK
jgi:hypothetical protein